MSILSSALTTVQQDAIKAEAAVFNFFTVTLPKDIAAIEAEAQVIAQDLDNGIVWMGQHSQQIASTLLSVISVVGPIAASAGVGLPVSVVEASAAITSAAQLVQAAVSAQQASQTGGGTALQQAVAAGGAAYTALKTAQGLTATALGTAVSHAAAGVAAAIPASDS